MVFFRLTGRLVINIHSANAEGAVGNYMGLSKMFVARRTADGFDIAEEPVISGNMVKHWHAVALVELLKSWGYGALCEGCKRHIMYRSTLGLNDEINYVEKCAIEDIHGFLDVNKQIRRESLAKFSFLVPVEEIRAEYTAVTHNRVVVDEKGAVPEEKQQMMVMKREHASGVYGPACSMDLAFAGRSLADPNKAINGDERKLRAKAAVLALSNVLSGQVGAAQARALPIVRAVENICVVSRKPVPNLVHGFYSDYADETARLLAAIQMKGLVGDGDIKVFAVGKRPVTALTSAGVQFTEKSSVVEAIAEAAEVVEEWL